jgi:hypothetical protein
VALQVQALLVRLPLPVVRQRRAQRRLHARKGRGNLVGDARCCRRRRRRRSALGRRRQLVRNGRLAVGGGGSGGGACSSSTREDITSLPGKAVGENVGYDLRARASFLLPLAREFAANFGGEKAGEKIIIATKNARIYD